MSESNKSSDKKQFCIVRCKKLKKSDLHKANKHNKRLINVPNADGTNHIECIKISEDDYSRVPLEKLVKNIIQKKRVTGLRTDSVYAIEFIITATPTFFSLDKSIALSPRNMNKTLLRQWSDVAIKWLKKKFGDNLLQVQIHYDESTPHIHAFVLPIISKLIKNRRTRTEIHARVALKGEMKNRLCAKEIVSKQWLYNLHDEHAHEMKIFGLSRPKLHSQATHQSLKAYYSLVKETGEAELKLEETLHGIRRATNKKNNITKELDELQNKQAKVDSEIQVFRAKIPKIKDVQKLHLTRISEIKKMKQSVGVLSASIEMLSSQKEQLENEVKDAQNHSKIYSRKHLEFAKLFAEVECFQSRFNEELSGFEVYLNAIGVPSVGKQKLTELITEFKEKISQIYTPTKDTTAIKKSHRYNDINNTNPLNQQGNRIKPK